MANVWDMGDQLANGGFPSIILEDSWYNVTLLTAAESPMISDQKVFENGRMTVYFEDLWNGVAADLGKDSIDAGLVFEVNGYATPEFEDYWEDLIT